MQSFFIIIFNHLQRYLQYILFAIGQHYLQTTFWILSPTDARSDNHDDDWLRRRCASDMGRTDSGLLLCDFCYFVLCTSCGQWPYLSWELGANNVHAQNGLSEMRRKQISCVLSINFIFLRQVFLALDESLHWEHWSQVVCTSIPSVETVVVELKLLTKMLEALT